MANQTPAREDTAAGGILEGDAERDCLFTSKRRTQWHLGIEGELQRGGACSYYICSGRTIEYAQAKLEPGPSGLSGLGGADVKMEDVGDDDEDEDEDDEDMEEVS